MLTSLNFENLLSWLMMMTRRKWHCDCQLLLQFCGTAGIILHECRWCILVDAWLCVAKLVWRHLLQHFVKIHHANLVASATHINNSHPSVGNFRRLQCSPAINALGMQFYCDASQHLQNMDPIKDRNSCTSILVVKHAIMVYAGLYRAIVAWFAGCLNHGVAHQNTTQQKWCTSTPESCLFQQVLVPYHWGINTELRVCVKLPVGQKC